MPAFGVYGWSPGEGGVHFHRVQEPLRVWRSQGIPTMTGARLDDEVAERHDTILGHMLWDERSSEAWEKLAKHGRHRLVFDIDDAMWAPDWSPFQRHYTPEVLRRVWRNIELAHVVTTPSTFIAEYVAKYNRNVWYVPNTVPEYVLKINKPTSARRVIGYQGSPSHAEDFNVRMLRSLLRFLEDNPEWNMHFYGPDQDSEHDWPKGRVAFTPWQKPGRGYYLSLAMDVGIGPLKRSTFNAGKSALRAIEYSALGIVPVLSDEVPYAGWIESGVNGILVPPGADWGNTLTDVVRDPLALAKMGQEARERAKEWTTEIGIGRWTEALNSAGM